MKLTDEGRARVAEVAARHGVGTATAERLAAALARSGGGQAQFDEAELGGFGQWSRGGMVMIGDMFNNALKARVDALCSDLSALVGEGGLFAAEAGRGGSGSGSEWPEGLGVPSSAGAQNDMRYAVFPDRQRLAVSRGGKVTVYDTGEHRIGGVSQQQSGDQSLTFTSQLGPVQLTDLPVVSGEGAAVPSGPRSEPPSEAPDRVARAEPARDAAPEFGAAACASGCGGGRRRGRHRDDRTAGRAQGPRDPDRRRVRAEEGGSARPAVGHGAAPN